LLFRLILNPPTKGLHCTPPSLSDVWTIKNHVLKRNWLLPRFMIDWPLRYLFWCFFSSSNFLQISFNFLSWFCSHNHLNNLVSALFLNWIWKFAPICIMHHLLWTSGHYAALWRSSYHLWCHSLPAKYLCAYRVWHTHLAHHVTTRPGKYRTIA
jgi:hypothetical protein